MKKKLSKQEHLKSISTMGWDAKVKKYGLEKAKRMMREQSQAYWKDHKVIHKKVKNP